MQIYHVQISVKFRAFKITFKEVRKQWDIYFDLSSVRYNETGFTANDRPSAFNSNGVNVKFW